MIKVRLLPQWLNIKADNSWRNKHKTKQMTRDLVHFTAPHSARTACSVVQHAQN